MCKELILLGGDPNQKDSVLSIQNLETPLHLAVVREHLSTIKLLVKYIKENNSKNIVIFMKKGQSYLDLANEGKNQSIIDLLEEWTFKKKLNKEEIKMIDL